MELPNSKKIVSVQDISCYGQCSLTVALPILSAYGIETAILPSAILSTHTGGFTDFAWVDLTEEMPRIVDHWIREGITFDAIYTGYIGDARQFDMIRDAAKSLMKEGGLLFVDPAMADYGKLYTALGPDIVEGMRNLVRAADVILPNLTEASFLLDVPYQEFYTEGEIKELLRKLSKMGPELSIVTGVSYEEGRLGAVAYSKSTGKYTEYFTERIPKNYHGTGDIFSSVAIASLLNGASISSALQEACEFVVKSIKSTLPDAAHNYGAKFEHVLMEGRRQ